MLVPRMTWGNWLFWGIMAFFGINFLWIGLLEEYVPLWVGALVALIASILLFLFGPRENSKGEEV